MPYFYGAVYQVGHVHKAVIADTENAARELLEAGRGIIIGVPSINGEIISVDHIQPPPDGWDAGLIWDIEAVKKMKGE